MSTKKDAPGGNQGQKKECGQAQRRDEKHMPQTCAPVKARPEIRLVYSRPAEAPIEEDPLQTKYLEHAKNYADLYNEEVQLLVLLEEIRNLQKLEQAEMTRLQRQAMEAR